MLLLYTDKTQHAALRQASPEEMRRIYQKYVDWGRQTFVADNRRLTDDYGAVLRAGAEATDGPYSETKEVLAGYFTIEAATYQEAISLSRTHPHLEHGGTIEVRQACPPDFCDTMSISGLPPRL